MEKYKYHIIYKTTNLVNNKIYVGLHSTNNLEDRYLGSGWVLKDAIEKYGRDKFVREILYVFNNREDCRKMEALIVDAEFVQRKDTYNLQVGGMGVENQWGESNHMFGKIAHNAKELIATHKDGTVLTSTSIKVMEGLINIDRANIRKLIKTGKYGRRGWKVELVKR
jgi:hypothetical protein